MIGRLSNEEIEELLQRNRVGRLGCSVDDNPYVVPIHYAYDGTHVYAFSGPGRKVSMMRQQPRIAFQVDEVQDANTWRSVSAEGIYEELTDPDDRARAVARLSQVGAKLVAKSIQPNDHLVLFRLKLNAKAGRFEKRDQPLT